jgi:hypothetical protein
MHIKITKTIVALLQCSKIIPSIRFVNTPSLAALFGIVTLWKLFFAQISREKLLYCSSPQSFIAIISSEEI